MLECHPFQSVGSPTSANGKGSRFILTLLAVRFVHQQSVFSLQSSVDGTSSKAARFHPPILPHPSSFTPQPFFPVSPKRSAPGCFPSPDSCPLSPKAPRPVFRLQPSRPTGSIRAFGTPRGASRPLTPNSRLPFPVS